MPLMYKLVSQDYKTYDDTPWIPGKQVSATGSGTEMCTDQVLHCYKNKYIAMIMNIYHANIANPKLIQVSCSKIIATDGLKYACKKQTMLKELLIPTITLEQKVHFSILCALEVYNAPDFIVWADSWINDIDRSYAAADAIAATAAIAAAAAADAAAAAADAAAAAAADAAAADADADARSAATARSAARSAATAAVAADAAAAAAAAADARFAATAAAAAAADAYNTDAYNTVARFAAADAAAAAAAAAAINRQNKIIDFSALINQVMNK